MNSSSDMNILMKIKKNDYFEQISILEITSRNVVLQ